MIEVNLLQLIGLVANHGLPDRTGRRLGVSVLQPDIATTPAGCRPVAGSNNH